MPANQNAPRCPSRLFTESFVPADDDQLLKSYWVLVETRKFSGNGQVLADFGNLFIPDYSSKGVFLQ